LGSFVFLRVINPALTTLGTKLSKPRKKDEQTKGTKKRRNERTGKGSDMNELLVALSRCLQYAANLIPFPDKEPLDILKGYQDLVMTAVQEYMSRVLKEGISWCQKFDQGLDLCDPKSALKAANVSSLVLESLFQFPTPEDAVGTRPMPGFGMTTEFIAANRKDKPQRQDAFEQMNREDLENIAAGARARLVEDLLDKLK
jgi:hypothetical protein